MKKKLRLAALLAVAILLIAMCGGTAFADDNAQELNQTITSILDGLDLSELDSYLQSFGDGFIFSLGDSAREIIEYLINGNLGVNYSGYLGEIFSLLFDNVLSLLPGFAQIIALGVLCAIIKSGEGSIMSRSTSRGVCITCYSLIIAISAAMLAGIVSAAMDSINTIKAQVEIVTPILVTLTVLSGGGNSAAIYSPSALFISGGAVQIVTGVIFPATIAVIVINFISKLSTDISFSGAAKLIKNILKWIIGITLAVFSLFITVQSTAASLFDGIFFKATKYLVGNSVPVVGNFLSAGVDMVVAAGSLIRSSVGIVGIVLLIIEVGPPIVMLIAFSIMLKTVAAIMQPIGERTVHDMFADLSSDTEYLIAGMCTAAFMYALVVMLIINSTSNFI